MEKKLTKKAEALMAQLFSADAAVVHKAIEKIPDEGNAAFIVPMLRTYFAWERDETVRAGLAAILMQIKTEGAIPLLIDALDDPDFENERAFIISIFWNSGLFPLAHIDTLVRHAIAGDFMVALEVLTVIENIETTFDPEMAEDALFHIDTFLDEDPESDKAELLLEIKQILSAF